MGLAPSPDHSPPLCLSARTSPCPSGVYSCRSAGANRLHKGPFVRTCVPCPPQAWVTKLSVRTGLRGVHLHGSSGCRRGWLTQKTNLACRVSCHVNLDHWGRWSEATVETYERGSGSGDSPHLVIWSLATPPLLPRPVQALGGSNGARSGFVTRAHPATLET